MKDCIVIEGIETNNLKSIDISLEKKAINLIIGPSGSGKSSLAYDTVAQIGQHEFMAMFADDIAEPNYAVRQYHNMVAAIPIKQTNHNNNMHSTIGTYFGLNRSIARIFAILCGVDESSFTLNRASNLCPECHGIGTINELDVNRIIDYGKPIKDNPFRCWNKYTDFYKQMLEKYCEESAIDSSKSIRQISKEELNKLLYGTSQEKYSIKYKRTGKISSRTTKYYGVMSGHVMMPKYKPSQQFYSDAECSCCKGQKYSSEIETFKIGDYSIGRFMTTPFSELLFFVDLLSDRTNEISVKSALDSIRNFIERAIELKLGHLCFHRAIPSLSGGELQRLKMVQIFNSQLTDLLIVLDEPLAGLSGSEQEIIFKNIVRLSKNHTVLVIDHSEKFVPVSKTIYCLGPGSGVYGGNLIDSKQYLADEAQTRYFDVARSEKTLSLVSDTPVYHYLGASIELQKNTLNLVNGFSGVGKSTLLREYFPQQWDSYLYINQKHLEGNKNSSVATVLDIANKIADIYSKKTGQDKKLFSNHTGNKGACPICKGSGMIEYGYDSRTKISMRCEECEGTGFDKTIKKYRVAGKSIYDIWNMTIDEGIDYFSTVDSKITKLLQDASSIRLGHLRIGQATSTLSGGENIRIKILKASKSKCEIIGIDEPFKGLSNSEIYQVVLFLDKIRRKNKTIVVIDHSDYATQWFAKVITLSNRNGLLLGE